MGTPGLEQGPGAGLRDSSTSQPHPKAAPQSMGPPEQPVSPLLSSCFHKNIFPCFFPRNPLPGAQAGQALALSPSAPNPFSLHLLLQLQAVNTAFMVKHGTPFLLKTRSSIPSPGSFGMSFGTSFGTSCAPLLPPKPWRARTRLGAQPGASHGAERGQRSREVTREQGGDKVGTATPLAARRARGVPPSLPPPRTSSDE